MSREETQLAALQMALSRVSPLVRESLCRPGGTFAGHRFPIDPTFSFHESGLACAFSGLVQSARTALDSRESATVRDAEGNEWVVEYRDQGDCPLVAFTRGQRCTEVPGLVTLSSEPTVRLRCLEVLGKSLALPSKALNGWRRILARRSLDSRELRAFLDDLHDTPAALEQYVAHTTLANQGKFQLLVPRSTEYFRRLIGERGNSASAEDHAVGGARRRLAELAATRSEAGLLASLYLSCHPAMSEEIIFNDTTEHQLVGVLEFLATAGDRLSQLGAIELGLRASARVPDVKPVVSALIELLCNDDAGLEDGGFGSYAALYVLVSAELSRSSVLAEEPPYYKRMAALAQAALIQRQLASAGRRPSDGLLQLQGPDYMTQVFVDLRIEPRSLPGLGLPEQLRKHFAGRVLRAASRYQNDVDVDLLRGLYRSVWRSQTPRSEPVTIPYAPGPVVESEELQDLPTEATELVRSRLRPEGDSEPPDFTLLSRATASFSVSKTLTEEAARALTRCRYRLGNAEHRDELLYTMNGLAAGAAAARCAQLANGVRALVRTYVRDPQVKLTAYEALGILLVAAASQEERRDWQVFVGDALTELAFNDLDEEERLTLLGYTHRLCQLDPDLWPCCARAEAALSAFRGNQEEKI